VQIKLSTLQAIRDKDITIIRSTNTVCQSRSMY